MHHRYWSFVAALGLLCLVRGEQGKIGNCDRDDFFQDSRQCTLDFFVSIRKNPQGNCNTFYLLMLDCSKNVMKKCIQDLDTESEDNLVGLLESTFGIVLSKGDEEVKYCREGGLPLAAVTKAPTAIEKRCADRYYRQTPACGEDFIEIFQQNPADENLCREYTKAIDCAKFKIEQYCTRAEARNLRNELSEDFNPYCEADEIIADELARLSVSSTVHAVDTVVLWTSCALTLWGVVRTHGL